MNSWIKEVKAFAEKEGISFKEATKALKGTRGKKVQEPIVEENNEGYSFWLWLFVIAIALFAIWYFFMRESEEIEPEQDEE